MPVWCGTGVPPGVPVPGVDGAGVEGVGVGPALGPRPDEPAPEPEDRGCTAVAAGNDMLAVGCFAALEEAGLNCPADLSVVGFNDMPFIDRLRPPLTTIRFPHYQLGTEAALLLLERIGGQGGPVRVIYLAPELVVRGSTAPCRQTG